MQDLTNHEISIIMMGPKLNLPFMIIELPGVSAKYLSLTTKKCPKELRIKGKGKKGK